MINKEFVTHVAGGGIGLTLAVANLFLALFLFGGLRTFDYMEKQR